MHNMVPLPSWPNPYEVSWDSARRMIPYLTAKLGARKREAGVCPPMSEVKGNQPELLTFRIIVCCAMYRFTYV